MGKWYNWWIGWLALAGVSVWASNDFLTEKFDFGSLYHILSVASGTFILGVAVLYIHDRFQTENPKDLAASE